MLLGSRVDFRRLLKPELCPQFPVCRTSVKFRSVLVEATVKLDELVKKIGKAVEDSKPYWEARRVAGSELAPGLPVALPGYGHL